MKLVINTSVIISALLKKRSLAYMAIVSTKHKLYIPEYTIEEILKHMDKIRQKSELTETEIYLRILIIIYKTKIVPRNEITKHIAKAKCIIAHRDPKDVPFVATLLAIRGDGVVSYDSDYEEIIRLGYKWLKPKDII